MVFYPSSPESGSPRKSEANLENDTEKETRKQKELCRDAQKKTAKIPKSLASRDVKD